MPTKDSNYNPWWAKMVFDEYCSHYFALNQEQRLNDIDESIKALLAKDESGNSFGSKMVKIAKQRIESNRESKGVFGAKGGRPRKNSDAEQAGGAVDSNTITHTTAALPANHQPPANVIVALSSRKSTKPVRIPNTTELYDFAHLEGIDDSLAREWYDMTISRNWCDREGNKIKNWQAACRSYVSTRIQKLSQQEG